MNIKVSKKQFLLHTPQGNFKCSCECNIFTKITPQNSSSQNPIYICNACLEKYEETPITNK